MRNTLHLLKRSCGNKLKNEPYLATMIGREYLTVAMVAVLVVTSTRVQSAEEVTNNVTFTYRTTGEGNVSLTYPRNEASECIFDKRIGTLTCTDNKSFNNTTRVWNNEPASIKYIKINCKLDGAYMKQCYCINGTTGFRPCHLRRLDLGVLVNLTNLEVLDLSYNRLDTIQTEALQGLRNLKFVSFRFNYLKAFPTGLFCPSPVLKYLDIGSNPLKSYPYGSMLCKTDLEIKVLEVRNSTLDRIPDNALKNLTSLERFDLSFNPITSVTKRAFDAQNKITILENESFTALRNLEVLDLGGNTIHTLRNEMLAGLSSLKQLKIDSNRLEGIVNNTFGGLASLEILNIAGTLSGPNFEQSSLKILDVSKCQISRIAGDTFTGLTKLEHVDLRHNMVVTFPPLFSGGWTIYDLLDNPITCACTMTWLAEPNVTVGNHNVSVGNFKIPKCKVYTENATYYPHNLRRHQFMCPENNTCDTKCACFKLVQNGDVHLVKCRNGLQEVPVFIPSTTNSLFLDGNNFTSITALYPLFNFTAMKTVELYMNGSEIQTVIPDMFKPFTKLEILSLAYNKIVNIPPGLFRNNNILRQLYLQHNEIRSIEVGAFQDLPGLKELDLSGNHLTVLVPATVRELLALPASQYYFLAGNPWKCDCMAVAFKEFVDQERAKIRDRRTLGCDKGKEMVNVPKSKFTCSAEDEGSFGGKSAIIVGVIAGIAVFLVVMATCCYFRRELFSLLFFKTGCRIPGKKRVSGKHFDVLVNYDPTDEQCAGYVQRILLPKLKNNSYSIETSQHVIQDFEVTKKLLEDSRCSIFVIDKNFSSNAFLGQVFLAADKLQKHTKGHSVILLIHGDIDLMALEPEVMSHMRKGDYITARSRLWWERLVYELPDATSGFRPRADTADDEDVVVFSSLAEDQYEQI
ncbi:TOLL6-like protein [Mya arenaria]|uniref:TOLL6-like protein n=1 Tax=Mya arenaria TaxID=6604 RepID=A0ABY7F4A5_MYAAR|nr:TOLL6-like protein [Mya arenaria]